MALEKTGFACGRAVLFLFLVPHFRLRRKGGTRSESLPRCRRRKRYGMQATAYLVFLTGVRCSLEQHVFSPAAEGIFVIFRPTFSPSAKMWGGIKRFFHAATDENGRWITHCVRPVTGTRYAVTLQKTGFACGRGVFSSVGTFQGSNASMLLKAKTDGG